MSFQPSRYPQSPHTQIPIKPIILEMWQRLAGEDLRSSPQPGSCIVCTWALKRFPYQNCRPNVYSDMGPLGEAAGLKAKTPDFSLASPVLKSKPHFTKRRTKGQGPK